MATTDGSSLLPRRRNDSNLTNHTKANHFMFSLSKYYQSDTYIYYGTVLPVITLTVIFINILMIITIIKGKFRTSTYVLMVSIAIADCLTGLVPLPFNIYAFGLQKESSYLTVSWCYVYDVTQMFLPEVLHTSSLHLTVGLAVERFIVVTFPLKAKRICTFMNGIILSVLIFVISICSQIDLFIMVEFQPKIIITKSNKTIHGCIRTEPIRTNTEYIIRIVFVVFIPVLILFILTVLLVFNTHRIKTWRKSMTFQKKSTSALDHLNYAVILILIVVSVSELFVWTCLLVSRFENVRFTRTHEDLMAIGLLIFQITSPINFTILCCLNETFRKHFRTILCCCRRTMRNKQNTMSEKTQKYSLNNNENMESTKF